MAASKVSFFMRDRGLEMQRKVQMCIDLYYFWEIAGSRSHYHMTLI